MGRNSPVEEEMVRLVFTLRHENEWRITDIGAHLGKSRQWAAYVLVNYSDESLSLKAVQKREWNRKTDDVEDGVTVGLGKYFFKNSYDKLTAVLNDENIRNV